MKLQYIYNLFTANNALHSEYYFVDISDTAYIIVVQLSHDLNAFSL